MKGGSSLRLFGAPHRYLQGPGALEVLGDVLAPFGTAPLIVVDAFILEQQGDRLRGICKAAGLVPLIRPFAGEITYPAVDRLIAELDSGVPAVVAGVGGGKALDAAKAVARRLSLPVVTVPTIASNDSPTSCAIAMYDDAHVMIAVDRLARSPEAVIVDTAIIAKAPVRFLRAGIGDALSKKFEAEGCRDGAGITPFGSRPLLTAVAIADCGYRTLRAHAPAALEDCALGAVTPALEATVEATVLMSGLGFENGGLSLAHSLTRGLVHARGARNAIHGEQIAWATLVQLAAELREDTEIADFALFLRSLGLPSSLTELGMPKASLPEIDALATATMKAPHLANFGVPLNESGIVGAIQRVEDLATRSAAQPKGGTS